MKKNLQKVLVLALGLTTTIASAQWSANSTSRIDNGDSDNRTVEIMNLIEDLNEIIDGYNEIFVSFSSLNKKPIISIACRPETKSYNEPGDYNHRLENLCLKWKELKDSRKQKSKKINHSQESVKHWNKYTEGWIKELEKAYQEGKPEENIRF